MKVSPHPVYENIPDDPAAMREEIVRLRESEHVRRGEEGKIGLLARALRTPAPAVTVAAGAPAKSSGLNITQVVFGGITLAIAVGAAVVAFGENRAQQAADIKALTASLAEVRTIVAAFPTVAATVARLDGQAGQASQAREAARQDADRLLGEVRGLERQIGELKGRQDAAGTALVTLQGAATAIASLRSDVDGIRRENEGRDRVQDERLRAVADVVTGLRDALVSRGIAPPGRRQHDLSPLADPPMDLRIARFMVMLRPSNRSHLPPDSSPQSAGG